MLVMPPEECILKMIDSYFSDQGVSVSCSLKTPEEDRHIYGEVIYIAHMPDKNRILPCHWVWMDALSLFAKELKGGE